MLRTLLITLLFTMSCAHGTNVPQNTTLDCQQIIQGVDMSARQTGLIPLEPRSLPDGYQAGYQASDGIVVLSVVLQGSDLEVVIKSQPHTSKLEACVLGPKRYNTYLTVLVSHGI
jgi:hypothetical protein